MFGGAGLAPARSPIGEQATEICTIHESVPIEIRPRGWRHDAPFAEEHAKIAAVDDVIHVDVTKAAAVAWLAAIGDVVGVRVGELTVEDLAVVDDAVRVAVGGPFENRSADIGFPIVDIVPQIRE